jgi:hypothetical protein
MTQKNKSLKILPIENSTQSWLIKESCDIVKDPDFADFIIFEKTGDPEHEINSLKKKFNKYLHKLVFILSGDVDFSDNISIWFCSSLKPNNKNKFQIYTLNPRIYKLDPELKPKKIKGFFSGTIWNTPERQYLKNLSNNWVIEEHNWWGADKNFQSKLSKYTYDMMRSSYYTLCPRGKGLSSMRVSEALACGSIPILINDKSNPFYENYGDIPIRIPKSEIPNLNNIIDSLENPSKKELSNCLMFYKSNICKNNITTWTVCSGFSHKIISTLKLIKGTGI